MYHPAGITANDVTVTGYNSDAVPAYVARPSEGGPSPPYRPPIGFIVTSDFGAAVAYTRDTQGGLQSFFQDPTRPQLLIVEVTFPNRLKELAQLTGHLTPCMLGAELRAILKSCVTPPRLIAVHLSSEHRPEIMTEIASLSQEMESRSRWVTRACGSSSDELSSGPQSLRITSAPKVLPL